MQNLMIRKIHLRKLIFFLGVLLFVGAVLLWVNNLLVSTILAIVGFYLLAPWVDFLERRGFSRAWATGVPFLVLTAIIWTAMQIVLPMVVSQFGDLKAQLPKYVEGTQHLLTDLQNKLSSMMDAETSASLVSHVENYVNSTAKNIFSDIPNYISNSLTILFLAPFFTFFMLLDGRDWIRNFLALVPNSYFELALNLNHQISSQMGGFIRARLLETLIIAAITWIGLSIISFPYALVLSIIAGVLNLIPYLGPFIGAAPAFLIAFINKNPSSDYLWLTSIYAGAQAIDTILIVPFLVARIVNLHAVTVVLAVIIGSQVMGILGMIISIPFTSVMKVTFQALYGHLTDFRK